MRIDARLPLEIHLSPPEPARPDWLLLLAEGVAAEPTGWLAVDRLPPAQEAHPVGCTCCGPARDSVVRLLAGLFQRRARGETGFFRGVALCVEGEAARSSLAMRCRADPYVSATFNVIIPCGTA